MKQPTHSKDEKKRKKTYKFLISGSELSHLCRFLVSLHVNKGILWEMV